MDAMDVNWCLTCSRHIDVDGAAPYCSRECLSSDKPLASTPFTHPTPFDLRSRSDSASDPDDDFQDEYHSSAYDSGVPCTARTAWIGKGDAGIQAWARDVHPGPPAERDHDHPLSAVALRPPKLLLTHRRPIPPTLCMSKTSSAAPEPARPIRTPHKSLPSLVSQDTLGSYPTPSSSLSLATPASDAPVPPRPHQAPAAPHKATLIHTLAAHFRTWAATPAPVHVPHTPCAPACGCARGDAWSGLTLADGDARSVKYLDEDVPWAPAGLREKTGLGPDVDVPYSRGSSVTDDHHAYRARGRRALRFVS